MKPVVKETCLLSDNASLDILSRLKINEYLQGPAALWSIRHPFIHWYASSWMMQLALKVQLMWNG
jgi:hypothetical protein